MKRIDDLKVGDEAERNFTFTRDQVDTFANLVGDHAPVHVDPIFAKKKSFATCIVHGLFVGSVFSGLLGEQLPGPGSVINILSLKYHLPVPVGATVRYIARIKMISLGVRVVVLDLEAFLPDGKTCLIGSSNCSFPLEK